MSEKNPTSGVKQDKNPTKVKGEKPNIFVRIGRKIGNGWRAVRESPVATAIGFIGGSVATGVGLLTYGYLKSRNEGIDEEPIEQEFEDEYEPEEEEVQDETAE